MIKCLKALKTFSSLSVFLFFASISGTVIEAPSLTMIEKEISSLDENALVVFDVDYTLIVPNDRVLTPCGEDYFYNALDQLALKEEHKEHLESRILLQSKVSIIDENIMVLLRYLKEKQIKTIALTAIRSEKYGAIPDLIDWRINQLQNFGIDFDWAFPNIKSIKLANFHGKGHIPIFRKGILTSSGYPKGQVLVAFLKSIKWTPSKIIFVDDRIKYISSVEHELDKEHIEHISFHYTAATNPTHQLDKELGMFQMNYLVDNDHWLSDAEALELFRQQEDF